MTPGIITEWVLMAMLQGWPVEVDTFRWQDVCQQRAQILSNLAPQDGITRAWCEQRPVKKTPVTLKND